jgi:hypothetical protein
VTVSPTQGPPGTAVTVSLTGYPQWSGSPYSLASVRLGNYGGSCGPDKNGACSVQFAVPSSYTPGKYTIDVSYMGKSSSHDFTVTGSWPVPPHGTPTITLSPSSGPPGAYVVARFEGFPGRSSDLYVSGPGDSNHNCWTDPNGVCLWPVNIPNGASPGSTVAFSARYQPKGSPSALLAASASFTVVAATPQKPQPTVTAAPSSVMAGEFVTFHATALPSNTYVQFIVGGTNPPVGPACQTDASGACAARWIVTNEEAIGKTAVTMRYSQNGQTVQKTGSFDVKPAPTIEGKLSVYKLDPKTRWVSENAPLTSAAPGTLVAVSYKGIKIPGSVWGPGHNFSNIFVTFYAATSCGTFEIDPPYAPGLNEWLVAWTIPTAADKSKGYCPGPMTIYGKVPYCTPHPGGGDSCGGLAILPGATFTVK